MIQARPTLIAIRDESYTSAINATGIYQLATTSSVSDIDDENLPTTPFCFEDTPPTTPIFNPLSPVYVPDVCYRVSNKRNREHIMNDSDIPPPPPHVGDISTERYEQACEQMRSAAERAMHSPCTQKKMRVR